VYPVQLDGLFKAITDVIDSYPVLLRTLEDIASFRADAAVSARGLLMNFEKGEVIIGLLICLEVFAPTEQLRINLQQSYNSAAGVRDAVGVVLSTLRSLRNEGHYNLLWSKMETFVADYDLKMPKTPRQRRVGHLASLSSILA